MKLAFLCMLSMLVTSVSADDGVRAAGKRFSRMDRSRFQIGAYFLKQADDAHLREVKECGIDFIYGPNIRDRAVLDRYAAHGLGVIAQGPFWMWSGDWKGIRNGKMSKWERFTPADYEAGIRDFLDHGLDHPALWMLDITDEPSALDMPYIGDRMREISSRIPGVPLFCNLYPSYAGVADNDTAAEKSQLGAKSFREYIDIYCKTVPLDYISYDFYPYHPVRRRREQLIPEMFAAYEIVARACRRTNRSFWYVPQVNAQARDGHVEEITANRLRFQAFTAMAFGAEVINWACYSPGWWTNNVLTAAGEKTAQYDRLRIVNADLHALGASYMKYRNVATHLVGFPSEICECAAMPQEMALNVVGCRGLRERHGHALAIGEMVSRKDGTEPAALFVVAAGDPFDLAPAIRTVTFRLADGRSARVLGPAGEISMRMEEGGACAFELAENAAALILLD